MEGGRPSAFRRELLSLSTRPERSRAQVGANLATSREAADLNFTGVPSFAPEILRRVRLPDAIKAKKLKQALQEVAEEGVAQVFRPTDGSPALVGVVGPLQLDVLKARLASEYRLEIDWDVPDSSSHAGSAPRMASCSQFVNAHRSSDRGRSRRRSSLVFLARSAFDLDYTRQRSADIAFADVKDIQRHKHAT